MNGSIVVIEPMCRGFEHAQFNAPLLQCIAFAFPHAPVTFLAETTHIEVVRTSLAREASNTVVTWRQIDLPDRQLSPSARFKRERVIINEIVHEASDVGAAFVFFASATDTAVVAAKLSLYRTKIRFPVLMLLHGVLAGLEDRSRPLIGWRGISLALRLPHPRPLQLIVPGRPIQSYLTSHYPRVARHTSPLDHPSFWGERSLPQVAPGRPVRFGFFGVSAVPGFDTVVRVAKVLQSEGSTAEFSMVGHLNHPADPLSDYSSVPDAGTRLLSVTEYADRARRLTYALWTTRLHRSGLVTSSAFIDALSFVKPIIYLSNPVIDAYAELLGDIGYRCLDEQQMTDLVRSLAADWPEERYRTQCATILAGRRMFEPHVVAETLRAIVGHRRGRL